MSDESDSVGTDEVTGSTGSDAKILRSERRAKALDLWLDGATYRAIAEACGTDAHTAHDDVRIASAEVDFEREPERKRDVLRIERALLGIAGRIKSGDDFALDRLGKLLGIRAKLLGTLAPEQHEILGPEIVLEVRGLNVSPALPSAADPAASESPEVEPDAGG